MASTSGATHAGSMPSPELSDDELERAAIATRAIASQHEAHAKRVTGVLHEHLRSGLGRKDHSASAPPSHRYRRNVITFPVTFTVCKTIVFNCIDENASGGHTCMAIHALIGHRRSRK